MRETFAKSLFTIGYRIGAGVLVVGAVGCSDARVTQLELSVKELKNGLADLRTLQAQQSSDINSVRTEIREITGKVEEVQHVSSGKTQELEQTISALKSRVPPPAGVPEDILAADEERIGGNTSAAAELYKDGLQAIRVGDFDGARTKFDRFVSENPGTAFTDNALFWSGMASQHLNQLDRAVVSYSEVFQKYPAEDMVPPALYFLAEVFVKNGSKKDALLPLQKLVDEYARSPYAARGRSLLQQISGGSAGSKKRPVAKSR